MRPPQDTAKSLACALCLAQLVACGPDPPRAPDAAMPSPGAEAEPATAAPGARGANVVFVSIDTLRADRLSSWGYARPTSPTIDRLAHVGVRFENARAQAPWTLPSHMTLMSGLHPRAHGATRLGRRLPDDVPTLAEVLRRAGYRTFAFTTGGFVGRVYGFDRGFETYFEQLVPLAGLVHRAIERIESLGPQERYFLFLQTFDVHCPYIAAPAWVDEFVTRPPEDRLDTAEKCDRHYLEMGLSDGQVRFLSEMYDAGIRQADEALRKLVGFLLSRRAFRDTIVVVLSDHGEEFGEHGGLGHGKSLHEEVLRVPLVIVAPGVAPGVVTERVGLIDVMPTVLDLLELPEADRPAMQGRSLVAEMTHARPAGGADAPHFAETTNGKTRLRGVLLGDFKLIVDVDTGASRLYDLAHDPGEQTDLAAERPDVRARLEARIADHFGGLVEPPLEPVTLPPSNLEQLRALGYVD